MVDAPRDGPRPGRTCNAENGASTESDLRDPLATSGSSPGLLHYRYWNSWQTNCDAIPASLAATLPALNSRLAGARYQPVSKAIGLVLRAEVRQPSA